VERGLSFDEWSAVRRGFELVGFWQLPARAESGMDGTTWIIVGTSPARAHRVVRWCAQELWPLGDLLLRLADLDPECEQVLLCSSLNSPA
jgi:hypothetical protein